MPYVPCFINMIFTDITTDTQTTYSLKANEKRIFFLHNRPGDIEFRLAGTGSEARVFALFSLSGDTKIESRITQIHLAPDTASSLMGRSILSDRSSLDWKGLIKIEKNASGSDGHQEMRNLLLSDDASALAIPSLEIENNDVRCGHASATSAPNRDSLFFLRSRGLSEPLAERMLVEGFINDMLERLPLSAEQKESIFQSVSKQLFNISPRK